VGRSKKGGGGALAGSVAGNVFFSLNFTHLLLLWLSSASPLSLRFRSGGLSTKEHSVPLTWQPTQASSSSLMTQSSLRRRQASQGGVEWPFRESESGESNPLRRPGYESRLMLP